MRAGYREIARFPGYRFHAEGYVTSAWQPAGMGHGMKIGPRWKRLRPPFRRGYLVVTLSRGDGTRARIPLHVAIAEAFFGPKPAGMHCCHNDGDSMNCSLSNLRYDTPKGNNADKYLHGTMHCGERHHSAKLTENDVRAIRRSYGHGPVRKIAERYGITLRNAWSVIRRETWKHVA